MVGNPAIPLDALGRYMADIQYTYPTTPDLVLAELADFGGLHGGFALE